MSDWTGRRVLVTGAGGFIGSHLVERLVDLGANVRALVEYNSLGSWGWLDESPVRGDIEVVLGDVRDRDSTVVAAAGRDVVFHLAALIAIPWSYDAPAAYVETNVVGTLNVLRAAQQAGVERVVHTSTSEVYGSAQYAPIDEAHPLQAQSPYAASKIGADKIAEAFHLSFGLPVATLRPFNTYGPRQSARAVIPTILTQLLAGGTIALGNLAPTRDFTYVTDTVEAFVKVVDVAEAVGRVLNVGTGRDIAIGDLAERIEAAVERRAPIDLDPARVRPDGSEVERLCADADEARRLLAWEPRVTLDEGLVATAEWIGRNLERYRIGAYTV
jgi:NAD dependent epimerase/dehydratase